MAEQFANRAQTVLGGNLPAAAAGEQSVFTVGDASKFPTQGDFRIIVDDELMLVTAVNSNQFTATRGIEGTTPTSHQASAPVTHVLTAGALRALGTVGGHNLLSSIHPDTVPGGPVRGDLIIGNSTPAWSKLPVGRDGDTLVVDGSEPNGVKWGDPGGVVGFIIANQVFGF